MAWTVDFYQDADGAAPVEAFLNALPMKHRAKLLALIAKLKEYGPTLPFPYSSQVEGRLRELRTRFGKTRLRILYFADAGQKFILLHGMVKDSERLDSSDIAAAKSNMADHIRRLARKSKRQSKSLE